MYFGEGRWRRQRIQASATSDAEAAAPWRRVPWKADGVQRRWSSCAGEPCRSVRTERGEKSGGLGETRLRRARTRQAGAARERRRHRPRPQPGLRPQEPQRDGLLLPAPASPTPKAGEDRVHHARGPHGVEVPGLRPRPDCAAACSGQVVTAKDLMVQPNPPRFLREGDVLEFTVKVTNQSATRQTGKVRLTLADARTGKSVDRRRFGNRTTGPGSSTSRPRNPGASPGGWRCPTRPAPLSYKAVGSTGRLSDGEEGFLPVLVAAGAGDRVAAAADPRPGDQEVRLRAAACSRAQSKTLQNQSLTVQMVSNPAWYAVMALPYLMEYPYECTEQTFNRLYANALARHIAASDPKIRRVFDQWKGTPALDSPLEKNQDLKSVMLEETPWVRQAQAESQARRNVGILFDDNRLNDETARLLQKLSEQQMGDGAWPWFPGGPAERLHHALHHHRLRPAAAPGREDRHGPGRQIARPAGRLDRPGVSRDPQATATRTRTTSARRSRCTSTAAASSSRTSRSPPQHKEAVDYFLGQARKYWLQAGRPPVAGPPGRGPEPLRRQAGRRRTSCARSRSGRSANEEMGMFWRDMELSWWWYPRPDRNPGDDDRGLRRSDGRRAGGRGLQGLALEAEADPGLEDHQGHGRRRLCPAAPRRQPAGLRRAGRGHAGRHRDQAARRSRRARASTSSGSCAARSSPRWARSR